MKVWVLLNGRENEVYDVYSTSKAAFAKAKELAEEYGEGTVLDDFDPNDYELNVGEFEVKD